MTFKQVALLPNISVESRYSQEAMKMISQQSALNFGRSPKLLVSMAFLCDQNLLGLIKKDCVEIEGQISNQIAFAVIKLPSKRLNCSDVIKA